MCRALKLLCVATDGESLAALKRAVVSAEWELTPGAEDEATALAQIDAERPHIMVSVRMAHRGGWGPWACG